MSDLRTDVRASKPRGGYYREEVSPHNASYALTEGNKYWKYPLYSNNNESNSIRKRDGDVSSNNSKSGSK